MTQGRKSRWTARAFFYVLGVVLFAAMISAAPSAAAPATEEYDLALPEADGDSSASEDEAVAPGASTAPPTAPAPETVAPEGGGENAGGSTEDLFGAPATDRPIRNLAASDSGDGGFPALLILLGVIAATGAGVAIFRFRRSIETGAGGRGMSSGTQSP